MQIIRTVHMGESLHNKYAKLALAEDSKNLIYRRILERVTPC